MRAKTDLHRALVRSTIDLHRSIKQRQENVAEDRLTEREQQFQHDFSGGLGTIAGGTETVFEVLFDIIFLGDSGVLRDSQLGAPVVRFGFHLDQAPPGAVPYAFVSEWLLDDDFNYRGAKILVGVHSTTAIQGPYRGTVHSTFQGFGAPVEENDGGDGSGFGDGTTVHGTGHVVTDTGGPPTGSTMPAAGGAPPSFPSGPPPPPPPHQPPPPNPGTGTGTGQPVMDGSIQIPPAGSLGPTHQWRVVADEFGTGGSMSHFSLVTGKAAPDTSSDYSMQILNGLLTTQNAIKVSVFTTNQKAGSHPTAPTNQGGYWYRGDKYAAQWLSPGRIGEGYKLRVRVSAGDYPAQQQLWSIVVNMKDRATGLAFWFGTGGTGWTRDLRKLGTVQQDCGDFSFGQNFNSLEQSRITTWCLPPAQYGHTPDLWAEVWRDGDYIRAGVWPGVPDTTEPLVLTQQDVHGDPSYGPSALGYWGVTADYLSIPGQGNNQVAGWKQITLYQKVS